MTVSVDEATQIVIHLGNADYLVPWGKSLTVSSFYIRDRNTGADIQVDKAIAANLFAASKAYTLLVTLFDGVHAQTSINYWKNVYNATADILNWQNVADITAKASGMFLGAAITGKPPIGSAVSLYAGAVRGVTKDIANMAAGALVLADAAAGVDKAFAAYCDIQRRNPSAPVSYELLRDTVNGALTSLAAGSAASNAISTLGELNKTFLQTVTDYFKNLADALIPAVSGPIGGVVKDAADVYGIESTILSTTVTGLSEASYIIKIATAAQQQTFQPLTWSGIQSIQSQMTGASYIAAPGGGGGGGSPQVAPVSYYITPGVATVQENAGTVYLQVTRVGTASQLAQPATVKAYTLQNYNGNGVYNHAPDGSQQGNYYYQGLDDSLGNNTFTFGAGQATILVPLKINDLHLSGGAETFGFRIASTNGTVLNQSSFTIFNTDTKETYGIVANASFATENGPPLTFTITRANATGQETVYVSTVDTLGVSNTNGGNANYYYNSLNHYAVTFAPGSLSTTVSVSINDPHLTSGSETFLLAVQKNQSDSLSAPSTYLTSATFTILNTDTDPSALSGDITGTVDRTGTTTIDHAVVNLKNGADLRNSGTLTISNGGFITADSTAGNTIDNQAGGTFSILTGSSIATENFNNSGRMVVSPSAGNTVVIGSIWYPGGLAIGSAINNLGNGTVEVNSGTLQIYGKGSSSGSAFSVANGATLLFTSQQFTISGGTYKVSGTTELGNSTTSCNLTFTSGTTVNVGSNWQIDGPGAQIDMSAATLVGDFAGLHIAQSASLLLGANVLTIANLAMDANAVISDSATVTITGNSNISGFLKGSGAVVNTGTASVASGASVNMDAGEAFENVGFLSVGSNATMGNASGVLTNDAGGEIDLNGTSSSLSAGIVQNSGTIKIYGASDGIRGFLQNNGVIEVRSGSLRLDGGGSSSAAGYFVGSSASLSFSSGNYALQGGVYDVAGSTSVASGATLKLANATTINSQITNNGTVEISSGTVTFAANPTGSGTVLMDPAATVVIASPASFNMAIAGFTIGDTIDLSGISATSATLAADGTLTVANGGTTVATLHLTGMPSGTTQFAVASDGSGGTSIAWPGSANSAFSVTPYPGAVNENAGTISFTVKRNGSTSAAQTVYVSTVANQNYANPDNYYFQGLDHVAVYFAAGSAVSAPIALSVNDRHITAGSETFQLVVQEGQGDSTADTSTYLAFSPFTINNTDAASTTYSGSYSGTINATGTTAIVGQMHLSPADLKNSGTLTVGQSGGIDTTWNGGEKIENLDGATFVITIPTTLTLPEFDNQGLLIASPGAGNTAQISGGLIWPDYKPVGSLINSGNGKIRVDSGKLDLHIGGSASANAFTVAPGATLEFSALAGNPFTITGGTFNIDGTISVGDTGHDGNLIFGNGANVNLGGKWTIYGAADMSSAMVGGLSDGLYLRGNLKLGSNSISLHDLQDDFGQIIGTGVTSVSGDSKVSGNWSGGTLLNLGNLQAAGLNLIGAKLQNDGSIDLSSVGGDTSSTFVNDAGGGINLNGFTTINLPSFSNAGLISVSAGSSFMRMFTVFNNTGQVEISSGTLSLGGPNGQSGAGGTSSASGFQVASGTVLNVGCKYTFSGGSLTGDGTLSVSDTLKITGSTEIGTLLSNTGIIEVQSGTLTLDRSASYSGQIILDAGTELALKAPAGVSNTISGFVRGTSIDLAGIALTSASITNGHLIANNGAVAVADLKLGGTLPANGTPLFLMDDGMGGKVVSVLGTTEALSNGTVCFADGTGVSLSSSGLVGGGTTVTGGNNGIAVNRAAVTVALGFDASVVGNDDVITASGNASISVSGGNNTLIGGSADNVFSATGGTNTIDGGDGTDTVALSLRPENYYLLQNQDGSYSLRGPDGEIDTLKNIEQASFSATGQMLTMAQFQAASFNPLNYIASYPDLITALGDNAQAGVDHYMQYGYKEGRTVTFDPLRYVASYADLTTAIGADATAGVKHYLDYGFKEGRKVTFDPLAYIASYPDLVQSIGDNARAGVLNYLQTGFKQGRTVSFDPLAYIASYPDLIKAYGDDALAGDEHYLHFGYKEGRTVSFNGLNYIASYPDLIKAFGADAQAGIHQYLRYGYDEGRSISFDPQLYIASNSDLIAAYGNNPVAGATHYIEHGYTEVRPTTGFDAASYLASYSDLQKAFGTDARAALVQYITTGYFEQRTVIDGLRYIASYADLIKAYGDNAAAGLSHYTHFGRGENRTVTFDPAAYLASYTDLQLAFGNDVQRALDHYIQTGFNEHRSVIDGLRYIASYPDLMKAFGENAQAGLQHYLQYGRSEGRTVKFDPLEYIASNPDLIKAIGNDPAAGLHHYFQFGFKEGRPTNTFNASAYLASYTDLQRAFGDNTEAALIQYIRYGYAEGRTVVDGLRYIASYADLMKSLGENAQAGVQNYLQYGRSQGRTVTFDPLIYAASNVDLAKAFGTDQQKALHHYFQFGFAENRPVNFDPVAYLLSNPDLGRGGYTATNAVDHYLRFGVWENRLPEGQFGTEQKQHALTFDVADRDTLDWAGDRDWFSVNLVGGQSYDFSLSGADSNLGTLADPFLGLYDANGELVTSDNDNGPGRDSLIHFAALTSGTYYLVASGTGTGTYNVLAKADGKTSSLTSGSEAAPSNSMAVVPVTSVGQQEDGFAIAAPVNNDASNIAIEQITPAGPPVQDITADPFLDLPIGTQLISGGYASLPAHMVFSSSSDMQRFGAMMSKEVATLSAPT